METSCGRLNCLRLGGLSALAVMSVLIACSSGSHQTRKVSTGSPPWDVCGQKISLTAAGWIVEDASQHDLVVNRKSAGDNVYLQFSHNCKADVRYQIVPADAATVVATAPPNKPVAVVLHPMVQKFAVTFRRPSGPGEVTVDFTQPTTSLSTPAPPS